MGFAAPIARRWAAAVVAALVIAGIATLVHSDAGTRIELLVGSWQNALARSLGPTALAGPRLYLVAFIGGLAASLSPCILGTLPLNLAFMGAVGAPSRARAAAIAGGFAGGVGVVNVMLGLTASLFFAVIVVYRSPINIGVGLLTIVMGLWMAGIVRLPTPQIATHVSPAGPFVAGLVFALVASPCASPVLVTVLGAATSEGDPVRAVLAMIAYTVGYTAVLFAASLFAGIVLASRKLLAHGETITRVGAGALVVIGAGTVAYGWAIR